MNKLIVVQLFVKSHTVSSGMINPAFVADNATNWNDIEVKESNNETNMVIIFYTKIKNL